MNGYGSQPINGVYGDNDAAPIGAGIEIIRQSMREFSQPIVSKIDQLIGVFERHEPQRYRNEPYQVSPSLTASLTPPAQLADWTVSFNAWSFIVNNLTGYTLYEAITRSYIPPNQLNFVVRATFATDRFQLWAIGGTDTGHEIYVVATEERLSPGTGDIDTSGGGGSVSSVTIQDSVTASQKLAVDANGKVGINNLPTAAALVDGTANPTTSQVGSDLFIWNGTTWDRWKSAEASDAQTVGVPGIALLVYNGSTYTKIASANTLLDGAGASRSLTQVPYIFNGSNYDRIRGVSGAQFASEHSAANEANGQQTSTATAATLVGARATRKFAEIFNTDAANAVWVGAATVTTANGIKIPASQSRRWYGQTLCQIIDNGSHAVVDYIDYYD